MGAVAPVIIDAGQLTGLVVDLQQLHRAEAGLLIRPDLGAPPQLLQRGDLLIGVAGLQVEGVPLSAEPRRVHGRFQIGTLQAPLGEHRSEDIEDLVAPGGCR